MELTVIAFVLPVLSKEWGVSQAAADALASIMFVGMLVGALAWGLFTDTFGRKAGWMATTSITAIAGALSAAAPDGSVLLFLVLRAAVGLGLSGTNLGFALCSELLPQRTRGKLLMYFELFFVGGSVFEVLLAWAVLDHSAGWRWVLLLSTLPLWIALTLSRLVPESPRWLTAHGEAAAAAATLRRAARANGQPLPFGAGEALACSPMRDQRDSRCEADCDDVGVVDCDDAAAAVDSRPRTRADEDASRRRRRGCLSAGVADAIAHVGAVFHPSIRASSVALCAGWFLLTFTYFGCMFITPKVLAAALPPEAGSSNTNSSGGGGDGGDGGGGASDAGYATSLLATLAEVPGLLLATLAIDRAGRVRTVVGGTLLVAAALASMAFVAAAVGEGSHAAAVLLVVLLVVGRAAAFGSYSALYVLSAELLPTRLRATGFGIVSAASRLAGTATPFVAGSVWAASPAAALTCYAAAAALCALVVGRLQDTRRRAMPEEIEGLKWSTAAPVPVPS